MKQTILQTQFFKNGGCKNLLLLTLLIFSFFNNTAIAQVCTSIQFSENNNQLTISGLDSPISLVKVYDANWTQVYNCNSLSCGSQIMIPNLSNGLYHIDIKLFTAGWSQICALNEDYTMTGVSTGQQPDLTVSNFQNIPNNIKLEEVNTFNFDLNNIGNGIANGAYDVEVYLSLNQNLSLNQFTLNSFFKVGEVNTGNTPIGTIPNVTGALNVPSNVPLGNYYLVLIADGTEVIAESDETNNVLVSDQPLTVSGGGGTGGTTTVQCGEVTINYGSGRIEMSGSNNYFFKIHDLNAGWAEVFSCTYQCGGSQTATNLPNGDYLVRVYNLGWSIICEQEINLTNDGGGNDCGSFEQEIPFRLTSFTPVANISESAAGYMVNIRAFPGEFTQANLALDGTIINTNLVQINEPEGTFTYEGGDFYYSHTRADKVVTLSKKTLSGGVVWSKNYTLNNSDPIVRDDGFAFKELDDGLILIARYGLTLGTNLRQIMIKTDLNGNENWQKQFPVVESTLEFLIIEAKAKNGGYYFTQNPRFGVMEVLKLDNNGNEQWNVAIAPGVAINRFNFVGESPDGNSIYLGHSEGTTNKATILKKNAYTGETIWSKVLSDMFYPNKSYRGTIFYGAVITTDGNLVAGYFARKLGGDGGEYGKLDPNGNMIWAKEMPDDSRYWAMKADLATTDGGVLFWNWIRGSKVSVMKIDADGVFDPLCEGNTGGSGTTVQCGEITINYEGSSVQMSGQSGNNYFFKIHDLGNGWAEVFSCSSNCGSSQTATINQNGSYLVRVYNSSWSIICEQEIFLDNAGSRGRENTLLETFTVFPNPAQEQISIDLKDFAGEKAEITISNIYGQKVQQIAIEKVPSEVVRLSLENYVNGFYFVNIQMEGKRLRSEKFLVKRLY